MSKKREAVRGWWMSPLDGMKKAPRGTLDSLIDVLVFGKIDLRPDWPF